MRRRRVIAVVGACVVIAILAVAFWPGEREPEYQGKKLSEWLDKCEMPRIATALDVAAVAIVPTEVEDALRRIGTNALPCLLEWISYDRPAWRDRVAEIYEKLPSLVQDEAVGAWVYGRQQQGWERAKVGFRVLGPEAAPAVPRLVKLLKESKSVGQQWEVLVCLSSVGPGARAALPYLRELGANQQSLLRVPALQAMERIEPGSGRALTEVRSEPALK